MVSSMISAVTGTLVGKGPSWVDIAVGGVTLRLSVPGPTADGLDPFGSLVSLFTSLQVREDSLNLYGFATEEARSAFETLIGVNGVGPKVALSVLSMFMPDALAHAIESADTDAFSRVPGIGKKTASRIVLELRGKLDISALPASVMGADSEAVDALTALGYSQNEARDALASINKNGSSVEEMVRLALSSMGQ